MASLKLQMTLFTWAEGLYPRRLDLYLRAKGLPKTLLSSHLTIVKYTVKPNVGFVAEDPEYVDFKRPQSSFPSLLVQNPEDTTAKPRIIHESNTIMEFFEDVFANEGRNLSGTNAVERAHIKDILRLIDEILLWSFFYGRHAMRSAPNWAGLQAEHQSNFAALDAKAKMKVRLGNLQDCMNEVKDADTKEVTWLAGNTDGPTMADCALMAWVVYSWYCHQWDILEGFEDLQKWKVMYQGHESFTDLPELDGMMRKGPDDFMY